MSQQSTALGPFMGHSVVLAKIAGRAGDHKVIRSIGTATSKGYYMVYVVLVLIFAQLTLAVVAPALLPLILRLDVFCGVGALRLSFTGIVVASVGVCTVAMSRIGYPLCLPTFFGVSFTVTLATLAYFFGVSCTPRPASGKHLFTMSSTICSTCPSSSLWMLGIESFAPREVLFPMRSIVFVHKGLMLLFMGLVVIFTILGNASLATFSIGVKKLGSVRFLLLAGGACTNRGISIIQFFSTCFACSSKIGILLTPGVKVVQRSRKELLALGTLLLRAIVGYSVAHGKGPSLSSRSRMLAASRGQHSILPHHYTINTLQKQLHVTFSKSLLGGL